MAEKCFNRGRRLHEVKEKGGWDLEKGRKPGKGRLPWGGRAQSHLQMCPAEWVDCSRMGAEKPPPPRSLWVKPLVEGVPLMNQEDWQV